MIHFIIYLMNNYLQLIMNHQNNDMVDYICTYAAMNGHLEILKWARENGCKWETWTCAYAAKNGHLEVLKWARGNDCGQRCDWNSYTCANAAENGHLEV